MDIEATIAAYRDQLRIENLSPITIKLYSEALGRILRHPKGPMHYLQIVNPKSWRIAKNALLHHAHQIRDRDMAVDLMLMRPPRLGPRRPIQIPDVDEWRRLGRRAMREKVPFGCVLWLQIYSGLRIGDIMEIEHGEVLTAAATGRTTMHQKGWAHRARRDWIPGELCQPTIIWLAENVAWSPDGRPTFGQLWQLVGPHKEMEGAQQAVRAWIPQPWTPHTFRHTVPSYLYEMGYDLETIASITGHESVDTLRRHYIHVVTPRRTLAAQRDLRRMLFPDPTDQEPPK